jgi:hypothetical protein
VVGEGKSGNKNQIDPALVPKDLGRDDDFAVGSVSAKSGVGDLD